MSKLPRLFNRSLKYRQPRPHSLAKRVPPLQERASGEMAEWLKAHAWKACVRETVPWVRIPLSPPCLSLSGPDRQVTSRTQDMGDNLVPNGLSRGCRVFCSTSKYPRS